MTDDAIIQWLLEGDVSIRYQVRRNLLDSDRPGLRRRIESEGWGRDFLSRRSEKGHWGRSFYQPKWISTHYTLLDLKNLNISPDNLPIRESLKMILQNEKGQDGGINPSVTIAGSDICVSGMALNYFSYFKTAEEELYSIVDFLLSQQMGDGGFNCRSNGPGAVHSSLHTSLSVAEGIREYLENGYTYRGQELQKAELAAREFILRHRLYKSDHTGEIIDRKMLMLSYPSRWRYDILRCLDYFRSAGADYDSRMDDAVGVIMNKRRKDGRWPLQARHPGQTHFEMEKTGTPSRWNTLRALRVLRHFRISINSKPSV